jgi:hypothetical protein
VRVTVNLYMKHLVTAMSRQATVMSLQGMNLKAMATSLVATVMNLEAMNQEAMDTSRPDPDTATRHTEAIHLTKVATHRRDTQDPTVTLLQILNVNMPRKLCTSQSRNGLMIRSALQFIKLSAKWNMMSGNSFLF